MDVRAVLYIYHTCTYKPDNLYLYPAPSLAVIAHMYHMNIHLDAFIYKHVSVTTSKRLIGQLKPIVYIKEREKRNLLSNPSQLPLHPPHHLRQHLVTALARSEPEPRVSPPLIILPIRQQIGEETLLAPGATYVQDTYGHAAFLGALDESPGGVGGERGADDEDLGGRVDEGFRGCFCGWVDGLAEHGHGGFEDAWLVFCG